MIIAPSRTSSRSGLYAGFFLAVTIQWALLLNVSEFRAAKIASARTSKNSTQAPGHHNHDGEYRGHDDGSTGDVANVGGARVPPEPLLSDGNLEIVRSAPQLHLRFVPVPNRLTAGHPHVGARDPAGNWGYIHDAGSLRSAPPAFDAPDPDSPACTERDSHSFVLTKKVRVDLEAHEAAEREADPPRGRVRILCVVYTVEGRRERIRAIRQTWGPKCDGFLAASNRTVRRLGTADIPHEGDEHYMNIWQKTRSIWSYVYHHYYEDYDYFHLGGDDLYLLVENLRLYLESDEIRAAQNGGVLPNKEAPGVSADGGASERATPLLLGRRFMLGGEDIYTSGGSGHTLNRAALKLLVKRCLPDCGPHLRTGAEDVMLARCLRRFHVVPYDTKDEAGGERYMPFAPDFHLLYRPPADIINDWYARYSIDCKWGMDHMAARAVAFHYVDPDLMRRMHAILYGYCNTNSTKR